MDYRDFKTSKDGNPPGTTQEQQVRDGYWWEVDDADRAAQAFLASCDLLAQDNTPRNSEQLVYARLYANRDLSGFGGGQYGRTITSATVAGLPGKVTFNVIASCVETLVSKVTKGKPRPTFLTSGQSWDLQRKGRELTKFMHALFHATKVHQKAAPVITDACVFGTGFLHVFLDYNGRVAVERVLPSEIFVDDADALHGEPRVMARRKAVDRMVLVDTFGDTAEKKAAILNAKVRAEDQARRGRSDMVEVWEGWHLGCAGKPGRHIITVGGVALVDEPWKLECFPFVTIRYRDPVVGFWGQGVAELLSGIQVEMNRLVRSISEQLRRKGRGRIFFPKNSINPEHLDNSVAPAIPYTGGVPPTVDNASAVSQDEFMQVDRLYQRAYQIVGMSELSAQSKKPSGLDAAVALREFNDIETERFAFFVQAYERVFLDFAELALDLIRESGGRGYKVRLPSKRYMVELDFKDIGLEKDDYVIQMYSSSSLPSTPGARLQRVEELRAGGYIDMATAKRLLDFPDVDAEMSLQNAAADDVDACISKILDQETPEMPDLEPYQDLELVIQRGTVQYLYAKHHGCEEDRLDMLRQYIDLAAARKLEIMSPPQPELPAGAGAPGMPEAPMGAPAPGPVNNNLSVNMPAAPAVPPLLG